MTRLRRTITIGALAAGALATAMAVTGCSTTVALDPGPDANAPGCAEVMVRLPDSIDGQTRVWTDAQATAAWGSPSAILLTCGVEPPAASELPCQSANGVDWIIDDSEAPRYRVTTFGRTPAVQVYLDNDVVSSADTLERISNAVAGLPTNAECTDRPQS